MAMVISQPAKQAKARLNGGRSWDVFALTFDTDYAAGGYALTAANLGFATIEFVGCSGVGGYVVQYDYANSKMMVMYGNNDAADGPLIEVANGADGIADLVTRILVIGTV